MYIYLRGHFWAAATCPSSCVPQPPFHISSAKPDQPKLSVGDFFPFFVSVLAPLAHHAKEPWPILMVPSWGRVAPPGLCRIPLSLVLRFVRCFSQGRNFLSA